MPLPPVGPVQTAFSQNLQMRLLLTSQPYNEMPGAGPGIRFDWWVVKDSNLRPKD
jgi:hypothetical protein